LSRRDDPVLRRRFLARHRAAESYAGFADFGFFRMEIAAAHLVAGFGRIADLEKSDLLTGTGDAAALADAEEGAVAHMNEDHRDAIELYATKLLGDEAGDWRIVSLDPEGCDLSLDGRTRRLEFPERAADSSALRRILVKLVGEARARG
jgi:heme iron utilization protein